MAAPYLAGSNGWLICTPLSVGPMPGTHSDLGKGTVFAVNVDHIIGITDMVDHYDENGSPVLGQGVNILIEQVGRWVTIEGTRNNVAQLLGIT